MSCLSAILFSHRPTSIIQVLHPPNPPTQKETIFNQLKKCSSIKNLEYVYASMIKTNANRDCFLLNQFVGACSALSKIDYAVSAFLQMENPNVFVYYAMIRGFSHCFYPAQALECYVHMLRADVMPASYTFSSLILTVTLIKACSLVSALGFGEARQCQTALIDFYSNFGKIGTSKKVFDEMVERDVFTWTVMVSAHVRAWDLNSARRLFEEMPERNTATWNTIIDGYARVGNMPARDIILWTTMITCYTQNRRYREALAVFNEMTSNGISPDEVTMATIISACAHLGALDLGNEIYLYVLQNGFDLDVYIGSALIDMYAKCGSLDRSLLVFFKLWEKNLFCWNSVIEGLAVHGFADEALKMFSRMEREKIKPNGVTFINVLSACTHVGLVEEGRRRFLSMVSDYSIPHEVGHFGCMVDLLSKAGFLRDALELIRSMKVEPNSVIWGALLGGCKLHRNWEIAQVAVNELMVLEPNNNGYYNLVVNMYARVNRWGEVAKIRAAMKNLRVEKSSPRSSWIEMGRKIHQFAAFDKTHPAYIEIYLLAGYVLELTWGDLG
ncbi:hypothetical protein I3842_14G127200 [Carya illinoinensis]|uniref:Chlororespiratory reduction 4 n=1 Tax=Carya illinoinensis TaxID=32201 RepID=A0A922AI82_CARIL|nr:hypothetical protein I3842_14G127200 [Carya illinoinensis]